VMKNTIFSLFFGKTEKTYTQFIRYFFVGGIAFCVEFLVFYLFIMFSFFRKFYIFSGAIAFLCGLLTNYLLSIKWVFPSRKLKSKLNEFLLFSLVGIAGLLLNLLFLYLFSDIIFPTLFFLERKLTLLFSKVIATFLVFLWNFFARKFLLF